MRKLIKRNKARLSKKFKFKLIIRYIDITSANQELTAVSITILRSNGTMDTFHVSLDTIEGTNMGVFITNSYGYINPRDYPSFFLNKIIEQAKDYFEVLMSKGFSAHDEGMNAFKSRILPDDNPYSKSDWKHCEWHLGWLSASECDKTVLWIPSSSSFVKI